MKSKGLTRMMFGIAGLVAVTLSVITLAWVVAPGGRTERTAVLATNNAAAGQEAARPVLASKQAVAGSTGKPVYALQSANGTVEQAGVVAVNYQPRRVAWVNRFRYTVRPGDSLYRLAVKFGVTVAGIRQISGLDSTQLQSGQILNIPKMRSLEQAQLPDQEGTLSQIFKARGINGTKIGLEIFVDKSTKTLSVFAGNIWLKSYHVELGDNGLGDKLVSGDHKTPEGTFYISELSVFKPADEYLGSRWMRLSYPNSEDAQRGLNQRLIDASTYEQIVVANRSKTTPPQRTALGGGVGIHGGSTITKGSNWTWGCVGLSNKAVEEIFPYVTVGTPVVIRY
jgi:LysM repeat protein